MHEINTTHSGFGHYKPEIVGISEIYVNFFVVQFLLIQLWTLYYKIIIWI
jgi:hypothetical protein